VNEQAIERAVAALRAGELVAFPTETVYGLGADAENAAAVRRIFEVKGRPADHPLIVHLSGADRLSDWAAEIPESAWRLAERFWPGPLTLILSRSRRVNDVVTGGLDTVGLRVPNHAIALNLLRLFGGGVAAPSANRFGRVSPTTADHVQEDLGSDVAVILDGGACSVGLESTIVDLSSSEPSILRPGGVTAEQLEAVLGHRVSLRSGGPVRSPGQHALHYSPRARVAIVDEACLAERASAEQSRGARTVVLCCDCRVPQPAGFERLPLPDSLGDLAQSLYATLREVDRRGFDLALVVLPPEAGLGAAIADRLRRAAGPRGLGE
jgi:L-threonylcarbamoyladenylate synthase